MKCWVSLGFRRFLGEGEKNAIQADAYMSTVCGAVRLSDEW